MGYNQYPSAHPQRIGLVDLGLEMMRIYEDTKIITEWPWNEGIFTLISKEDLLAQAMCWMWKLNLWEYYGTEVGRQLVEIVPNRTLLCI